MMWMVSVNKIYTNKSIYSVAEWSITYVICISQKHANLDDISAKLLLYLISTKIEREWLKKTLLSLKRTSTIMFSSKSSCKARMSHHHYWEIGSLYWVLVFCFSCHSYLVGRYASIHLAVVTKTKVSWEEPTQPFLSNNFYRASISDSFLHTILCIYW